VTTLPVGQGDGYSPRLFAYPDIPQAYSNGGFKMCHDGFTYTKKAEKKNRIRWELASSNSDSDSDALFYELLHFSCT